MDILMVAKLVVSAVQSVVKLAVSAVKLAVLMVD